MVADQQSKQSGLASLTGMFALVIVGFIVLVIAGVFLIPKLMGGSSGGSGIVGVPSPSAFSTSNYLKPALIIGGVVLLIIVIIVIVVLARKQSTPPPTSKST